MSETGIETIRVLVADSIAPEGVRLLEQSEGFAVDVDTGMSPETLRERLPEHDALIVRSATKVTADVLSRPGRLRVIGRAGTGVDNIDLEAATRSGVVVVNTPGGNSVAAAEQTVALLLALARNVPQANRDLIEGRWERKRYVGVEVAGKVLGIVGLGKIGREVARRARGLRMELLGFDPYVSGKVLEGLGVESAGLDDVLARSDFLTLHLPLGPETRHVIDAAALTKTKRGVRLINCARGGLVDESALLEALESGQVGGAALDVFEQEPPGNSALVRHPRVVATPHLGASTVEAQQRVGTEIAEKVRDFFRTGVALDAVNLPPINREEHAALAPLMNMAEKLGCFLAQMAEGGFRRLELRCYGEFVDRPLQPLVMAATKGMLLPILQEGVALVNALSLARERGITVEEGRSSESTPYSGLLRMTLTTDTDRATVAGTLFEPGHPRLVEVEGLPIDCPVEGHLILLRNRDVPGVVGRIGTVLGRAGVNIAGIELGRTRPGDEAVSVISVDGPVAGDIVAEIRQIPEILRVRTIRV